MKSAVLFATLCVACAVQPQEDEATDITAATVTELQEVPTRRLGDTAGQEDVMLASVLEAAAADEQAPHAQHRALYSFLSEDFRVGGQSTHNTADHYIRHQDLDRMTLTTLSGQTDGQDATFLVREALCHSDDQGCPENAAEAGCVSLMSANYQGYYLKHVNGEVRFEMGDGGADTRVAFTFCLRPGISEGENTVSLQVPSGGFVMHKGYMLVVVDPLRASPEAASFRVRKGFFKGFCAGPDNPTECTCQIGYLGDACDKACPGLTMTAKGVTTICGNHGDCGEDEDENPSCECHEGYMGETCGMQCPKSPENFKVCHDKGTCQVGSIPAPLGTNSSSSTPQCVCDDGYKGPTCSKRCPGAKLDCSGHGECFFHTQTDRAKCRCEEGFIGFDCMFQCSKGSNGKFCSGNGMCNLAADPMAQGTVCDCNPGFVGDLCDLECPRAEGGAVCSGTSQGDTGGQCMEEDGKARCRCFLGFSGDMCQIRHLVSSDDTPTNSSRATEQLGESDFLPGDELPKGDVTGF